jgi:hypothetical protein
MSANENVKTFKHTKLGSLCLVRIGLVCLFSKVFPNNELNCHLKIWVVGSRKEYENQK